MTENLFESGNPCSILANNPSETVKQIWELDVKNSEYKHNAIYQVLGLRASFKTLLGTRDHNLRQGNFGLYLYVDYENDVGDINQAHYVLDSQLDMFGDPYNFQVYFSQEKKIDISALGNVTKLTLCLYQLNNFEYLTEQEDMARLPHTYTLGETLRLLPNNIFVNNIELTFGLDTLKMPNREFQIYTSDSLTYSEEDKNREIRSLWYNKNSDNEYIGFSDGVFDEDYDEEEYIKEYAEQSKALALKSQIDSDENCPPQLEAMRLLADAREFDEGCSSLSSFTTGENFVGWLRTFWQILRQYQIADETIDNLFASLLVWQDSEIQLTGSLKEFVDFLNGISPQLETVENFLASLAEIYSIKKENKEDEYKWPQLPKETIQENVEKLNSCWANLQVDLEELVTNAFIAPVNENTNVKAQVEKYRLIIHDIIAKTNNYVLKLQLENAEQLIDTVVQRLQDNDLFTIDEDYQKFVEDNANKYCIYWYENSKRLDTKAGLPTASTESGNYTVKVANEDNIVSVEMNCLKQNMAYSAELYYNHIKYESNVITFTNEVEVVDEVTADSSNALYIELSDNCFATYQLYGIDNYLLNLAERITKRRVRVRYKGEVLGDEALLGAMIFWYVPKQATQLTWDATALGQDGFSILSMTPDINQEYVREGFECFYKTIDDVDTDTYFFYRIKDYYNITATNNTIYCLVVQNPYRYEASYSFAFTSFGTSGTDYTLSITPFGVQSAVEIINNKVKPLKVQTEFYDYNNKPEEKEHSIILDWEYGNLPLSACDIYYSDSGIMKVLDESCYEDGVLLTNLDYYLYIREDEYERLNYTDVEQINIGTKLVGFEEDSSYYNVLKGEVSWTQIDEEVSANETLVLTSYFPVPIAFGDYYIEGASTVVYDSLGKNPTYYKEPYKIYDNKTHSEVTDVHWLLEYYKKDEFGNLIKQINNGQPIFNPDLLPVDENSLPIGNYLPKIEAKSFWNNNLRQQEFGYYLSPLNIYVDNMDYMCAAMCYTGEPYTNGDLTTYYNNRKLLWAQPILIMQNRYSSSMLNKWDESLTIDEENGIILSTMMGAGYKDNLNRFNGVLMGDVRTDVDIAQNLTGVGLYGFNAGAQSFAWDINGKGFIGKSGRGRLWFDGDNSAIFSEGYQYFDDDVENRTGMLIDFDDGLIQMYGQERNFDGTMFNSTKSSVRLAVEPPYFSIQDEGGYVIDLNASKTEDREYYWKTEEGLYEKKDFTEDDGYKANTYYYWVPSTTLMFIGAHADRGLDKDKTGYFLQSHNYQGLDAAAGSWQVVDNPQNDSISGYYEQVPEFVLDKDNQYNKYTNYYLKKQEVIVVPFEDFQNNLELIQTEYLTDNNDSVTEGRQYYVKLEDCSYAPVEVNKNIYEPGIYYYKTGNITYELSQDLYNENIEYFTKDETPIIDYSEGVAQGNRQYFISSSDYIPNKYYYKTESGEYELASAKYTDYIKDDLDFAFYSKSLVEKYLNDDCAQDYETTETWENLKQQGDAIVYIYNPREMSQISESLTYDEDIVYYRDENCTQEVESFDAVYESGAGFYYREGTEEGSPYVEAVEEFSPEVTYYEKIVDEETEKEYYVAVNLYSSGFFYVKATCDYEKLAFGDGSELNPYVTYYEYVIEEDSYRVLELFSFTRFNENKAKYYLREKAIEPSTNWNNNQGYFYNDEYVGQVDEVTFYESVGSYYAVYYTGINIEDTVPNPDKIYYLLTEVAEYSQVFLAQENSFTIGTYYVQNIEWALAEEESSISGKEYYSLKDNIYTLVDLIQNPYEKGKYYYKEEGRYQPVAEDEKYNSNNLYYAPVNGYEENDGRYYTLLEENGTLNKVYFYENNKYFVIEYNYERTADAAVQENKLYFIPQAQSGLRIDLNEGKIEGYNLYLKGTGTYVVDGYKGGNNKIEIGDFVIDTSVKEANGYPLTIGKNFKVSWLGDLIANSGKIGGWQILDNQLMSNNGNVGMASIERDSSGSDAPVFWADKIYSPYDEDGELKSSWSSNLDFYVTRQGKLKAKNASIEGSIYASYLSASSGKIGGWTIGSGGLYSGNTYLNSNGAISGATITGSVIKASDIYVDGNKLRFSKTGMVKNITVSTAAISYPVTLTSAVTINGVTGFLIKKISTKTVVSSVDYTKVATMNYVGWQ